jgi:hypothetical protein
MCPPAASSALFGKLGPIVPSGVWWVVGTCGLPGTAIGSASLIIVDCTSSLNRGRGVVVQKGTGQWRWRGQLWGKSVLGLFSSLVGEGVLVVAVATVTFEHVGVIDRAVVPVVGVPLREDAVSVMAVNMRSWTLATPMTHAEAVEAEPLRCSICAHHVAWTIPSDDNCRRAVDGT